MTVRLELRKLLFELETSMMSYWLILSKQAIKRISEHVPHDTFSSNVLLRDYKLRKLEKAIGIVEIRLEALSVLAIWDKIL